MKHRRTPRFVKLGKLEDSQSKFSQPAFAELPLEVKEQARKAFMLFQENPSHPSLDIERIEGYPGVWSGRISQKYRWTFHFEEDPESGERICVHRMIGGHEEVYRKP